jgi:type II secretory pathway component GspD/PulD (secretin)
MKTILTLALLGTLFVGCGTTKSRPPVVPKTTFSSFDQPARGEKEQRYGPGEINFKNVQVQEFLQIYQEISGRTVVTSSSLPGVAITLRNQTSVTRVEALRLFDTALAMNGIAMVFSADNAVKAVPAAMAAFEAAPVIELPAKELPDSKSYMVRYVHLKYRKPSEMFPALQVIAGIPNSIMPIEDRNLLVIHDYSSNIRQMLVLIEELGRKTAR